MRSGKVWLTAGTENEEMTEAIVVALITGILTLVGTVASNHSTHSKTIYRIDQLEKKVEKHNNLVERMYMAEGSINVLAEKQRDFENDLADLKGKV